MSDSEEFTSDEEEYESDVMSETESPPSGYELTEAQREEMMDAALRRPRHRSPYEAAMAYVTTISISDLNISDDDSEFDSDYVVEEEDESEEEESEDESS